MVDDARGQRVRIGVRLDQEPADLGEWLAEAAAFDAAGADALWLDGGPGELDGLVLAAALAAITARARLVVTLPEAAPERSLHTIGRLSRGRLVLVSDPAGVPAVAALRRVPGGFEGPDERWESIAAPQGRAAWRAAHTDAAERGITGLVVPADPRLLDILRNPDDPGDRQDLYLAQG